MPVDVCTLADTGGASTAALAAVFVLLSLGIATACGMRRCNIRLRLIAGLAVIAGAFAIGWTPQAAYAADPVCIAVADSSTAGQGQTQVYNVLANDVPAPGAHFVLASLTIKPAVATASATISLDQKTVAISGEGVYTANSDGTITFAPDAAFVGTATGVIYHITDSAGVVLASKYTPIVARAASGGGTTQPATALTLGVRAIGFEPFPGIFNGASASTSLVPGPARQWRDITSSADGSTLAAVSQGNYVYTSADPHSAFTLTRRTNAGQREWTAIASSDDGQRLVAVAEDDAIHTSTDGGTSWTAHPSSGARPWVAVASSSDGTRLLAAADYEQLQISNDAGASWTPVLAAGAEPWSAVTISSDGSRMAAVVGVDGRVVTSDDSGATWTEQTGLPINTWYALASSSDGQRLAVGGFDALYTSTDGGTTWTARNVAGTHDWQAIASSDDGNVLYAQDYGGYIYTSRDGGANWTRQNSSGQHNWHDITTSADGSRVAATADIGYVHTSNDSGATWTEQRGEQAIDPADVDIDPGTPGQQLAIDKTMTEGWSAVYDPATDTYTMTITDELIFDPATATAEYTIVVASGDPPDPARIIPSIGFNNNV